MAAINKAGFSCVIFLIVLLIPLAYASRPFKETQKENGTDTTVPQKKSTFDDKDCHGLIPGVNIPGINIPGVGVNVPGVGVNVPGVGVNVPGVGVNVPGVGVNIPGVSVPGVNIPGVNIPGVSIGIPGVSVGVGGVQFGVPGREGGCPQPCPPMGGGGCPQPCPPGGVPMGSGSGGGGCSGCGGCVEGGYDAPIQPGWGNSQKEYQNPKPNAEAAAKGQDVKVAN